MLVGHEQRIAVVRLAKIACILAILLVLAIHLGNSTERWEQSSYGELSGTKSTGMSIGGGKSSSLRSFTGVTNLAKAWQLCLYAAKKAISTNAAI